MQTCLLQGFKTELLCRLQLTFADRHQCQRRTTQQRLRPRALRQPLQGIMQMIASIHGTDSAIGDDALDGLPVSEQLAGSRTIAARLKPRQFVDAALRLIQTADQQQHPGVEQNQPRCAAQQALRQLAAPTQNQRQVLALQHLFFGKSLKKTTGHVRLPGQQGVLHRRANIALPGKPLTRMHMQSAARQVVRLPLQQPGQRREQHIPALGCVQFLNKHAALDQRT